MDASIAAEVHARCLAVLKDSTIILAFLPEGHPKAEAIGMGVVAITELLEEAKAARGSQI